MVPLSAFYQNRIRWHLSGLGSGIPIGDLGRIEQAFNEVPNTWSRCRIFEALDRCDLAFEQTTKLLTGLQVISGETYAGDINRTVARSRRDPRTYEDSMDLYQKCVDELARRLWVPSWAASSNDPYRYARSAEVKVAI